MQACRLYEESCSGRSGLRQAAPALAIKAKLSVAVVSSLLAQFFKGLSPVSQIFTKLQLARWDPNPKRCAESNCRHGSVPQAGATPADSFFWSGSAAAERGNFKAAWPVGLQRRNKVSGLYVCGAPLLWELPVSSEGS